MYECFFMQDKLGLEGGILLRPAYGGRNATKCVAGVLRIVLTCLFVPKNFLTREQVQGDQV